MLPSVCTNSSNQNSLMYAFRCVLLLKVIYFIHFFTAEALHYTDYSICRYTQHCGLCVISHMWCDWMGGGHLLICQWILCSVWCAPIKVHRAKKKMMWMASQWPKVLIKMGSEIVADAGSSKGTIFPCAKHNFTLSGFSHSRRAMPFHLLVVDTWIMTKKSPYLKERSYWNPSVKLINLSGVPGDNSAAMALWPLVTTGKIYKQ